MSDTRILPVVILYKMKYHQCAIYNEMLCNYKGIQIVVYDNSPEPQIIPNSNVIYYHNPKNGGVSAGYNYAAQIAQKLGNIDYLLLLDQDTIFPKEYIDILSIKIREYPFVNLFVPRIVYDSHMPFSPIKTTGINRNAVFLEEGLYSLSDYLPVNSGACMKIDVFDKVCGYNPEIRLDFADYDFFSRLGIVSNSYYVLGASAFQNFSNNENNISKLKTRYKLFIESGRIAKKNIIIRKDVVYMVIRHTLALTIRTKKLFFIMYFLKNFK